MTDEPMSPEEELLWAIFGDPEQTAEATQTTEEKR